MGRAIVQPINPEEEGLIAKIQDLSLRMAETYSIQLTDFLNPRQLDLAKNQLSREGISYFVSNDYLPSEYAKILLAPDYYELDLADFELALVEIDYQAKFHQLEHGQILGSLLNQLGLRRDCFGDILVNQGRAQVMVDKSLLTYVLSSIDKIGRAGVKLREVDFSQLITVEDRGKEEMVLVASLRLDAVLAAMLKLSRNEAVKLLEQERVQVNHGLVTKSTTLLTEGDLLSIRGFGRYRLKADQGLTKTGKHKLLIYKQTRR